MAWNPSPEVAIARDAAAALNAEIAIVLYVTRGAGGDVQLRYASYGETRALCDEARKLADVAFDALMKE